MSSIPPPGPDRDTERRQRLKIIQAVLQGRNKELDKIKGENWGEWLAYYRSMIQPLLVIRKWLRGHRRKGAGLPRDLEETAEQLEREYKAVRDE